MDEKTRETPETQHETEATNVSNPITETRKLINGILNKSPLTRKNTSILIISYCALLTTVAITLGFYNAFGVILLTNTVTVITITKHEKGAISATTISQKISYYGLALIFGFIGLYYLIYGLG